MLHVYGFLSNRYLYTRVNCILMGELGPPNLYMEKYFHKIFLSVFENLSPVLIGHCINFLIFFPLALYEFYQCLLQTLVSLNKEIVFEGITK